MAYKNVDHLRSHLSVFETSYPIKRGYIARLLLDHTTQEVVTAVRAIVEKAEPDKNLNANSLNANLYHFKNLVKRKKYNLTREWPSLRLFQEYFPITFKMNHTETAPTTPVRMSILSSSSASSSSLKFLGQASTPTSEKVNQTDSPQASLSTSCGLPSCRKLKSDDASRVAKQHKNQNMWRENKSRQEKFKELRKNLRANSILLKRRNEKLKRKTDSAKISKPRHTILKEASKKILELERSLNVSKQNLKSLNSCTYELLKDNKKFRRIINQMVRMRQKREEDLDNDIRNLHMGIPIAAPSPSADVAKCRC